MLKSNPIGFFDSGVGGLSVYSKFRDCLPNENTLYFGDLAHLPYGNKTQSELISYARTILNFYKKCNVKAVVIACNTSSAQAYETIKDEFDFKIYPIIQSCAKIIANGDYNRIGVFATQATVESGVYEKELLKYNKNLKICQMPCPNWVNIVENRFQDKDKDIELCMRKMLDFSPDKVVLGCTHYPYLLGDLTKFAQRNLFIDPAEIFVNHIKEDLKMKNMCNESTIKGIEKFFVSAHPEDFVKNSGIFYKIDTLPELVNL